MYPLLLLPLVENAFKYVSGDYNLTIKLCAEGDMIKLSVVNSVTDTIVKSETAGGIGLENLQRRLQLLYPEKYQFNAGRVNDEFIANLEIMTV